MFAAKVVCKPKDPFSFELSAEIFKQGDKQIRSYNGQDYKQIIRLENKLILVKILSTGSVEEPELQVQMFSNRQISEGDKEKTTEKIKGIFNLDLDLYAFYKIAMQDEILSNIVQKLWGLRSPTTQSVFEALVDSIIEQQISLKVATTLERRIIKKLGESLQVNDEIYYAYPTPKALALASLEELQNFGLSRRKTEYIKEIASKILESKLDLENYKNYENTNHVIEELDSMRGIGTWTAELTVIRSMHKWDAFPADDIGLRRILSHYYCKNNRISCAEASAIAKPWGKWRGLAAFYFVIADIIGIEA